MTQAGPGGKQLCRQVPPSTPWLEEEQFRVLLGVPTFPVGSLPVPPSCSLLVFMGQP